ncbi:SDR family oxidoreductase [Methylomarinum sp. Ch1-1]|uniref:SDR family oxidoreductase n=1 Tax=Methylomarinum roseum TaxID=3067653 RepID=A0AAU7NWB8_9GAMM|nr:SDR family oxidoreductase [Methylomarinum sp. Ch1-1]MDP4522627.1 SDR family oxidoreductase [Methylomarinum sp. Ch1-1]
MHTVSRTILVTGASSGIGRATARRLLALGHYVIGSARDCRCFTTEHPRFSGYTLDFSKPDSIPQLARRLQQAYPALDMVVFSAGYGQFGSLEEFSFDQIERLMMVNFTGQALLTRALLPELKRQERCNLVYIGSEAALQGSRKGSIYCASKFALRGFTQGLRDECGNSRVRVSLVNPGMVQTPFFDDLSFMPGEGQGQVLQADDVADAVTYILEAATHMVVDEINLSPANKVIKFKTKGRQ